MEPTEIFVERRRSQARVKPRRIVGTAVAVVVLATGSFSAARLLITVPQNRANIRRLCEATNQENLAIRRIVDRSAMQQFDPSKLSPDTKRLLAEFAAATKPGDDGKTFHDFVYSITPIQKC